MKQKFNIFILLNILILISSLEEEKYEEKIIYFPIKSNYKAFYGNIYIGDPEVKVLLPLDQ